MKYIMVTSGKVSLNKSREFEQTVQFIFNHLPPGCESNNLAVDVYDPACYHMILIWKSEEALNTFKRSNEFHMLQGAFRTLFTENRTIDGGWVNMHVFESGSL